MKRITSRPTRRRPPSWLLPAAAPPPPRRARRPPPPPPAPAWRCPCPRSPGSIRLQNRQRQRQRQTVSTAGSDVYSTASSRLSKRQASLAPHLLRLPSQGKKHSASVPLHTAPYRTLQRPSKEPGRTLCTLPDSSCLRSAKPTLQPCPALKEMVSLTVVVKAAKRAAVVARGGHAGVGGAVAGRGGGARRVPGVGRVAAIPGAIAAAVVPPLVLRDCAGMRPSQKVLSFFTPSPIVVCTPGQATRCQ